MLIPNTQTVRQQIDSIRSEWTEWFILEFNISLYVAMDSVECSAYEPVSYTHLYEKGLAVGGMVVAVDRNIKKIDSSQREMIKRMT